MVEKIRTWNEPVPDLTWGNLSKSDIMMAQRENLTRDEALMILDHWLDTNGDAWLSPKHPLRRIILGLRPDSPFTVTIKDHSWLALERTEVGKIVTSVWDVNPAEELSFYEGRLHRDLHAHLAGGFSLRDTYVQKAIA